MKCHTPCVGPVAALLDAVAALLNAVSALLDAVAALLDVVVTAVVLTMLSPRRTLLPSIQNVALDTWQPTPPSPGADPVQGNVLLRLCLSFGRPFCTRDGPRQCCMHTFLDCL